MGSFGRAAVDLKVINGIKYASFHLTCQLKFLFRGVAPRGKPLERAIWEIEVVENIDKD